MAFDVRIWETFQVASQNMGNSDGWMGLSRPWTWGNLNFQTGVIHQKITGSFQA